MTVQKFVTYNVLDTNGQISDEQQQLELTVLENSGNYLIHKDIVRQQIQQKQGTVSTKTRSEVRGGAVNHGVKKEQDEHELVQTDHLYGRVVVLFLGLNHEQSH